jgi:hypothetical protein
MRYEIVRHGPHGVEIDMYDLCLSLGFKSMDDFKDLLSDFAMQAVAAEAQRRAALRVLSAGTACTFTAEDVIGATKFILGAETVLFYQVRRGVFEGKAVRGTDTVKIVFGCKSIDEILQSLDDEGIRVDRVEQLSP